MSVIRETSDGVTINVRVQPGAKRSRVLGIHGDALKIAVAAPPVDGKANEALIGFLAELLGVRQSNIEVVRGATSRQKTILIRGGMSEDIAARFEPIA